MILEISLLRRHKRRSTGGFDDITSCWKTTNVCFYPLTSETSAAKGFSQAYILMILIPDTTSFIVRILLSVRTAVLLLDRRRALKSG